MTLKVKGLTMATTTLNGIIERWDELKALPGSVLPILWLDQLPESVEAFPSATIFEFKEVNGSYPTGGIFRQRVARFQLRFFALTVEGLEAIHLEIQEGFNPLSISVTGWVPVIFQGEYAVSNSGFRDKENNNTYYGVMNLSINSMRV